MEQCFRFGAPPRLRPSPPPLFPGSQPCSHPAIICPPLPASVDRRSYPSAIYPIVTKFTLHIGVCNWVSVDHCISSFPLLLIMCHISSHKQMLSCHHPFHACPQPKPEPQNRPRPPMTSNRSHAEPEKMALEFTNAAFSAADEGGPHTLSRLGIETLSAIKHLIMFWL